MASFSIVFCLRIIFLQLSVLSRQVGDLQADNLKLYEKIRFLQVIFFWSFEYSGIRKKIIFLDRLVVEATVGERSPSLWKTGRISFSIWTLWLFCWKYFVSLKSSFIAH